MWNVLTMVVVLAAVVESIRSEKKRKMEEEDEYVAFCLCCVVVSTCAHARWHNSQPKKKTKKTVKKVGVTGRVSTVIVLDADGLGSRRPSCPSTRA